MEGDPERRAVRHEEINGVMIAAFHEGGVPLQQTLKDQAQRKLAGSPGRQSRGGERLGGGEDGAQAGEGGRGEGGKPLCWWCGVYRWYCVALTEVRSGS